jgi:hypothetical protein
MASTAATNIPAIPGADKGSDGKPMQETLRSWMMVALTVVFLGIYLGALFGLIPIAGHTPDGPTLARIESVIFVIIGYYFGRLPSQATEKTLKEEVNRQTQKSEQAENAKETAQKENHALHQKVRSTRAALGVAVPGAPVPEAVMKMSRASGDAKPDPHQSIVTALSVLDS